MFADFELTAIEEQRRRDVQAARELRAAAETRSSAKRDRMSVSAVANFTRVRGWFGRRLEESHAAPQVDL